MIVKTIIMKYLNQVIVTNVLITGAKLVMINFKLSVRSVMKHYISEQIYLIVFANQDIMIMDK